MTEDVRFWLIEGYGDSNLIVQDLVREKDYTEDSIVWALQLMAAKHLSSREIIEAKRTGILSPKIDDGRAGARHSICIGENPYYLASLWTKSELAAAGRGTSASKGLT